MGPFVAVSVPAAGSYTSAVFVVPDPVDPPAIRTFPLGKSVAACRVRAEVMIEIAAGNIPVAGS